MWNEVVFIKKSRWDIWEIWQFCQTATADLSDTQVISILLYYSETIIVKDDQVLLFC